MTNTIKYIVRELPPEESDFNYYFIVNSTQLDPENTPKIPRQFVISL